MVAFFKGDLDLAWKGSCPQRRGIRVFLQGRAVHDLSCQDERKKKDWHFPGLCLEVLVTQARTGLYAFHRVD